MLLNLSGILAYLRSRRIIKLKFKTIYRNDFRMQIAFEHTYLEQILTIVSYYILYNLNNTCIHIYFQVCMIFSKLTHRLRLDKAESPQSKCHVSTASFFWSGACQLYLLGERWKTHWVNRGLYLGRHKSDWESFQKLNKSWYYYDESQNMVSEILSWWLIIL